MAKVETYQTVNPATGKHIKTYEKATDKEVQDALTTAHNAYNDVWKNTPVKERVQVLSRAADILREKASEYAGYIVEDMGKIGPHAMYEVHLSADILQYYADHAEEFSKPKELPGTKGAKVVTEPVGVILAIEPWNFPYYQLARVAGPQIAAGNVVIFKPAPSVPQCALAFARLFEEARAPKGVYSTIFASIDQVNTLIDDFRVRGVTLTGSERAGSAVAERAGRNLKKVVLELGGSDPFIVLEDAPMNEVISRAAMGRLLCSGQACAASKRFIIVGKKRGSQFLDGLTKAFESISAGDPSDPSTKFGPLVHEDALNGLLEQIKVAKSNGARVVIGGARIDRPGFYLEPTIITDISRENPIYHAETFGPVALVFVVDSVDKAIELANDSTFGLGASIHTANEAEAEKLASRIEAGMIFINSIVQTTAELPFGGVKNSGFGRELSELGFGEFVNQKLVLNATQSQL